MAFEYTISEQVDMLLVLGFCEGNCLRSVRVYHEKYPNRRTPNHKTFQRIEFRLRETGTLKQNKSNCGRNRNAITPEQEEHVLHMFEDNPAISSRRVSRQLGLPKSTVNRLTREQQLRPYHVQLVQELFPVDEVARSAFCIRIRELRRTDLEFSKRILFTDESCFTRRGITNIHNDHIYSDDNPYAIKEKHFQREFKVNIWIGLINETLVGPFNLPERLDGNTYTAFLREHLPGLLEDVPLIVRNRMWFMHDGAPPHFAQIARQHLHEAYPERWIGRGRDAPVPWPPRSPDLNPCDYFLWGYLKNKVYSVPINTAEQLWERILWAANNVRQNVESLRKTHFNFLRRINACINANGGHFEHTLDVAI